MRQLRASWLSWDKYGTELLEFVNAIGITYTPLDKKNAHATTRSSTNQVGSSSHKCPVYDSEDEGPLMAGPSQNPTSKRVCTNATVPTGHCSGTLIEVERAPYVYLVRTLESTILRVH